MNERRLILRWALQAGQPVLLSAMIMDCDRAIEHPQNATTQFDGSSDAAVEDSVEQVSIADAFVDADVGVDVADADATPTKRAAIRAPKIQRLHHLNCNPWTIELPPEGTNATIANICASSRSPVWSRDSVVKVVATAATTAPSKVTFWVLPSEPSAVIVGTPVVTLSAGTAGAVSATGTNTFEFPIALNGPINDATTLGIRVDFVLQCASGTKPVTSTTALAYCKANGDWISNGQTCSDCQMICEMAPSPIVPDMQSQMPLSRVHEIHVRAIARVGRSIVLHAIHDGDSIDWQVDAGTLQRLAADVAIWTSDDTGDAYLTTTVQSAEGLAVASMQLAA